MRLKETFFERMSVDESAGAMTMKFRFLYGNGIPTGNGRVYKATTLKSAVGDLAQRIEKMGPAYGMLGHQQNPELDSVAHLITGASVDEKGDAWATVKILDTKAGKNLQAIIKGGGKVGVSARGHGSTHKDEKGQDVVGDDYKLDGVDFVLNPSVDGNWVGQEHIFESAALNEVQVDIAEARYRAALVAGYKGDFETYKKLYAEMLESKKAIGDLHQASLDRVKNPRAADGFPAAYPIPDDKDTASEEDIAVLEAAFAEALAKQYPNLNLIDWDEEYLLAFDLNKSQHYQIRHGLDEGKGITLGKPEPIDY